MRWVPEAYVAHPEEFAFEAWRDAKGRVFRIRYGDGTEFLIEESEATTDVWVSWSAPLTLADAATYLIGPVVGLLLRRRGMLCLHASCVSDGSSAFALMGRAGAGKSTTASAFARLGYPVLTDDITTLNEDEHGFHALPGYPRLCLWPASVEALFGDADRLPRITPNWEKRYVDLAPDEGAFSTDSQPLKAIFLLEPRSTEGELPRVAEFQPGAALVALIANTYGNRVLDRAGRAAEFEALDRLVRAVAVRRVTPPADIRRLPELCAAILEDFTRLTAAGATR